MERERATGEYRAAADLSPDLPPSEADDDGDSKPDEPQPQEQPKEPAIEDHSAHDRSATQEIFKPVEPLQADAKPSEPPPKTEIDSAPKEDPAGGQEGGRSTPQQEVGPQASTSKQDADDGDMPPSPVAPADSPHTKRQIAKEEPATVEIASVVPEPPQPAEPGPAAKAPSEQPQNATVKPNLEKRVVVYTLENWRKPLWQWTCAPCLAVRNAELSGEFGDIRLDWKQISEAPRGLDIRLYPALHWAAIDGTGRLQSGWDGVQKFRALYEATQRWQKAPAMQGRREDRRDERRERRHPLQPAGANTAASPGSKEEIDKLFAGLGVGRIEINSHYAITIPENMTFRVSRSAQEISAAIDGPNYPQIQIRFVFNMLRYDPSIVGISVTRQRLTIKMRGLPDMHFAIDQ